MSESNQAGSKQFVPRDFSEMEFEELEKILKKEYWIEAHEFKGSFFKIHIKPLIIVQTAKANAYICALCRKMYYMNPMDTPLDRGMHYFGCVFDDEESIEYDACPCSNYTVPLNFFVQFKGVHYEISICHSCSEEYNIIDQLFSQK